MVPQEAEGDRRVSLSHRGDSPSTVGTLMDERRGASGQINMYEVRKKMRALMSWC